MDIVNLSRQIKCFVILAFRNNSDTLQKVQLKQCVSSPLHELFRFYKRNWTKWIPSTVNPSMEEKNRDWWQQQEFDVNISPNISWVFSFHIFKLFTFFPFVRLFPSRSNSCFLNYQRRILYFTLIKAVFGSKVYHYYPHRKIILICDSLKQSFCSLKMQMCYLQSILLSTAPSSSTRAKKDTKSAGGVWTAL